MRLKRRIGILVVALACSALLFPSSINGAWPMLYSAKRFSSVTQPVFITGDTTGSRLYIAEKTGRLLVTPASSQS